MRMSCMPIRTFLPKRNYAVTNFAAFQMLGLVAIKYAFDRVDLEIFRIVSNQIGEIKPWHENINKLS